MPINIRIPWKNYQDMETRSSQIHASKQHITKTLRHDTNACPNDEKLFGAT